MKPTRGYCFLMWHNVQVWAFLTSQPLPGTLHCIPSHPSQPPPIISPSFPPLFGTQSSLLNWLVPLFHHLLSNGPLPSVFRPPSTPATFIKKKFSLHSNRTQAMTTPLTSLFNSKSLWKSCPLWSSLLPTTSLILLEPAPVSPLHN